MNFKWTKIEQDAFKEIKWIVDHDVLLAYMYFNEECKIRTDAIKFQLVSFISHNDKPIYLYGRKMTNSKIRNTVTEKRLLIIVETLK